MKLLIDTYKKTSDLHHSYLFEGDRVLIMDKIRHFCESILKIKTRGNPDFHIHECDILGIDEGRAIKEIQNNKSFYEGKKIFIIAINGATVEAQNSLLKVFEEPTPDTHFFLIVPSLNFLLPTLKSRLIFVSESVNIANTSKIQKDVLEFISSSLSERIKIVKILADKVSKDEKTKSDIILFINNIEFQIKEKFKGKKFDMETVGLFSEIDKCRKYLFDRAPSVKMLLEHLAMVI